MVTDSGNDVDLYQNMTHLMDTKIISSGTGATDAYGLGYDVVTSAEVETFAGEPDNRVYYEGKHTDFTDTGDQIIGHEGTFNAVAAGKTNGSNWEKQVADQYGLGQDPGFYIEVSGKKLAVTYDSEKGEWKVDSSAVKVATNATIEDSFSTIEDEERFAQSVIDRYGLNDTDENNYDGNDPVASGSDEVADGSGFDEVADGSGSDEVADGSGSDEVADGSGSDEVADGSGSDEVADGSGSDEVADGSGSDEVADGSGSDEVADGSGSMKEKL